MSVKWWETTNELLSQAGSRVVSCDEFNSKKSAGMHGNQMNFYEVLPNDL